MKNFKIYEVLEFFWFFPIFFLVWFGSKSLIIIECTSCPTSCVNLVLTIILWLEPISFWSWNIEFFILEKCRFCLQFLRIVIFEVTLQHCSSYFFEKIWAGLMVIIFFSKNLEFRILYFYKFRWKIENFRFLVNFSSLLCYE